MFLAIEKLRKLDDVWLICLTAILMPLSIGLGVAFSRTRTIKFRTADTEVSLGEIRQITKQSKSLVREVQQNNQVIVETNREIQQAAKDNRPPDPKIIEESSKAIANVEELTLELKQNNQVLERKTSEVIKNVESTIEPAP